MDEKVRDVISLYLIEMYDSQQLQQKLQQYEEKAANERGDADWMGKHVKGEMEEAKRSEEEAKIKLQKLEKKVGNYEELQ